MGLTYDKTSWTDYVSPTNPGTSVDAGKLNKIENQLDYLSFKFLNSTSININNYHGDSYYGRYYCNGFSYISSSSTKPADIYTNTTSFYLEVLPLGNSNQTLQRLTQCVKNLPYTWERQYYSSSWSTWQLVTPILSAQSGTWTPSNSQNMTINSSSGEYYRIGNLVYIKGEMVCKATSSSGGVCKIKELPFTGASRNQIISISYCNITPDSGKIYSKIDFMVLPNTKTMQAIAWNNGVGSAGVVAFGTTSTGTVSFSGIYQVKDGE